MWLKARREELRISQDELAKRMTQAGCEVARTTISYWETNAVPISDRGVRRALASALEISGVELLRRAGFDEDEIPQSKNTPAGQRAVNIVNQMPGKLQLTALELLVAMERLKADIKQQ